MTIGAKPLAAAPETNMLVSDGHAAKPSVSRCGPVRVGHSVVRVQGRMRFGGRPGFGAARTGQDRFDGLFLQTRTATAVPRVRWGTPRALVLTS